jgi:hypothetical protein
MVAGYAITILVILVMLGQMGMPAYLLTSGIAVTVWARILLTMHMWDIRVGELLNKNRMGKINDWQKKMVATFDVGNGGRPSDRLSSATRTDKIE